LRKDSEHGEEKKGKANSCQPMTVWYVSKLSASNSLFSSFRYFFSTDFWNRDLYLIW